MDHSLQDFFTSLDQLYTQGKTNQIESFLKRTLAEHRICCGGHDPIFTAALHELGTYYRGVSRYTESAKAFEEAGQDILSYGTKDTIDYATNRINLGGTLRLMKQYSQALRLYEEARNIYMRLEGRQSYHYAAVLNNISLIYLDTQNYSSAFSYANEALQIISILPGYTEERAISLVNRGTAQYYLKNTEAAWQDATAALALYDSLDEKGIHYTNALNLLGTLEFEKGNTQKAYHLFMQAAKAIEAVFGKNDDYFKAYQNAQKATQIQATPPSPPISPSTSSAKSQSSLPANGLGLTICRDYYETIGKPMLQQQFAQVYDRIAAGLVGDGSECLGFDDEISQDHDWGPSFCIWLTNEDYAKFGQDLQKAYMQLPKEFHGYIRRTTPGGEGRVGVFRISDFYRQFIGSSHAPKTMLEWNRIPEPYLAKATNGEVFTDPLGQFTTIRNQLLQFYPEDVRLKKIAVRAAVMAQSGQYNYSRCLKRQEIVAANCALYEFVQATISMAYLLNKRYMPFYKWAHHGLQTLPKLSFLHDKLQQLCTSQDTQQRIALIEDICVDIRDEWRLQGIVDGPNDFLITYCKDIVAKIHDPALRAMHIMQEQ